MSSSDYGRDAFTEFIRESRPLSNELGNRLNPLLRRISTVSKTEDLLPMLNVGAVALVGTVRPAAPRLGGFRIGVVSGREFRTTRERKREYAARHHYSVQIEGDATLLYFWPSDAGDFRGVDAPGLIETTLLLDPPDQMWSVKYVDESRRPDLVALYTYFDLTIEEESKVASGAINLKAILEKRFALIDPIVKAIAGEVEDFFDKQAVEFVQSALDTKKTELSNREAVANTMSFPDTWSLPPIELESVSTSVPADSEQGPTDLVITQTPRLEGASFERLQRTIRIWADAVERYDRSFGVLSEDQISDLLAATLNATLSGAEREVFTRDGKSDIFVHADLLREGSGPAIVFITESKWATSHKVVKEALDPQLFGYLNTHDTSAVLLLLFDQKNFASAQTEYLDVLRSVAGFKSESSSAVAGWPIFSYVSKEKGVNICIATIHLARSTKATRNVKH